MGNFAPKWALCRPNIIGFFRFLQEYRERVRGEPPGHVIENAMQAWQNLSTEELSRYTDLRVDSPDVLTSEESIYPPHKPIRSYPVCNEMRCPQKRKKPACKRKKPACKRKKKTCRPKRKKKKASCKRKRKKKPCRPKRKAAACKKKRKPKCKVKRKPKMCPGKTRAKRFSFLSLFKRKAPCKSDKKSGKSAKKTYKCGRAGPITSNGFLNFMREYRKKHCGRSPQDTLKRGARAWKKLTCEEKRRYQKMGCGVTTSERRKKSPLCRKC